MNQRGVDTIRVLIIAIVAVSLIIIGTIGVSYYNYTKDVEPTTPPSVDPPVTVQGDTDSDGDGVIDDEDNCPTRSGPASNNGCPRATITPSSSSSSGSGGQREMEVVLLEPDAGDVFSEDDLILLRYNVREFSPQACWYSIDNEEDIILPECINSNFTTSIGQHNITIFANMSNGTTLSDKAGFTVTGTGFSVQLNSPPNDRFTNLSAVNFSYTPGHKRLDACSLYGNFSGPFVLNSTNNNPANYSINSFNLNLPEGSYKWAIRCIEEAGSFVIAGNRTITIDKTYPTLTVAKPSGEYNSLNVPLQFNVVEKNKLKCEYTVRTSAGTLVIPTVTITGCNNRTLSFEDDGNYVLVMKAYDRAGQSVTKNVSFSIERGLPVEISTPAGLSNIRNDLNGNYKLMNDIDLSGAWQPIGTLAQPFNGTFDGNGKKIRNLNIVTPNADNVGLFGVSAGTIDDVSLEGVSIGANSNVGAIAGINLGTIKESDAKGNVLGKGKNVGGLVGMMNQGAIENSIFVGRVGVTGASSAGGLVGTAYKSNIKNSVTRANMTGAHTIGGFVGNLSFSNVVGSTAGGNVTIGKTGVNGYIGGFAGRASSSVIEESQAHSAGEVVGFEYVGGFVGYAENTRIDRSYAFKKVYGTSSVGVMAGAIYSNSKIWNSHSGGHAEGLSLVGGLAGYVDGSDDAVVNSFSRAKVVGPAGNNIGGLIGQTGGGTCSNKVVFSFWDTQASGQSTSSCGAGKTTSQMKLKAIYVGWGFNNIWNIIDGQTYPFLRWQPVPSGVQADQTLTGHFEFESIGAASYTPDSSIYQRNAFVSLATITQGAPNFGNGLRFYGDNYVVVSPSSYNGGAMTFAAWVNRTADVAGQVIVSDSLTGQSRPSFELFINNINRVWFNGHSADNAASNYSLVSTKVLDRGKWYHIAIVINQTRAVLYIDGNKDKEVTITTMPYNSNNPILIGARNGTSASGGIKAHYTGIIDDVQIYNRALNRAEILDVMGGPLGSPSDKQLFSKTALTIIILGVMILIILVIMLMLALKKKHNSRPSFAMQPRPPFPPRPPMMMGMPRPMPPQQRPFIPSTYNPNAVRRP